MIVEHIRYEIPEDEARSFEDAHRRIEEMRHYEVKAMASRSGIRSAASER